MSTGTLIPVVQYLHRVTAPPRSAGLTDGELLERFASRRDQAAFAALVQRHGPMVMGVCRRLLRDRHEAEDAWQATFLILVRKAGAITRRELLAGWLYGVAYRTARRARRVAVRRQLREKPAGDLVAPASAPTDVWPDLRPILDEEIQRLPEKYRLPIVLCYFENRTNTEAARLLNCPRGTIATRLARARERLRVCLTRRGVTLSAGSLALAFSQEAVPAAVPGMLVQATVRAAPLVAAGAPAVAGVTAQAALLTQGVARMMVFTKLKAVLALLLTAGVVFSGSGLVGLRMQASENAPEKPARQADAGAPLQAVPRAKSEWVNLEDEIYAALRKDHRWKSSDLRCAVSVWEVKAHLLTDVLFKRYDADGVANVVAQAREAEIHVDLSQQEILVHARHVQVLSPTGAWANFADRVFIVPLSPPASKAQTDQHLEKPREDASITLLGVSASLSLMGERLDPPGKTALSCEDVRVQGQSIAFRDRVYVIQGNNRLECDEFQVVLDGPIQAFAEVGRRKWKEFRCDKNVCLESRVRQGGCLVHYTRLVAPAMAIGGKGDEREVSMERTNHGFYNVTTGGDAGGVRASGPGTFHDLWRGQARGPVAERALSLWRVSYKGRAHVSSAKRSAHFEDQVEVACVPSDEPNAEVGPDKLPEGGIAFRGENVFVLGQKSTKRQATRQLLIRGKAVLQSAELWGQADYILYDEYANQVMLRGDGSTPAFLFRGKKDGAALERISGDKIIYSLRTREVQVQKSGGASASP
jgi:RNA polymerase sigma factor (sigma-70 family)